MEDKGFARKANHREYVATPGMYDIIGLHQLFIMQHMGLHPGHTLLDIGCGSLCGGRFFMMYLRPGNYYGIEPNWWLIGDAWDKEVGRDLFVLKKPQIIDDSNFTATKFDRQFDYILAHSIFSHASLEQVKRCVSEVAKVMHNGSRFLATFYGSYHDSNATEWTYPGQVYYKRETISAICDTNDLEYMPVIAPHPTAQMWFCAMKKGRFDGRQQGTQTVIPAGR